MVYVSLTMESSISHSSPVCQLLLKDFTTSMTFSRVARADHGRGLSCVNGYDDRSLRIVQ